MMPDVLYDSLQSLPAWVQIGASFSLFRRRYHVRGVVDGQAVLREWWATKQRWNYTVESWAFFDVSRARIQSVKLPKNL